jgi:hypothetical protein
VVSADTPATDAFGQVALFETANGMPSGPLAILLAFILALLLYPVTRLLRSARRR